MVDSNKIVVKLVGSDNYDLDLVASFRQSFPTLDKMDTKEKIMAAVSLSPVILEWFNSYKSVRSAFLERPLWLGESVEGARDWKRLSKKVKSHTDKLNAWEARINAKAAELNEEVKKVGMEKESYFKTLDPLIQINSLTVQQLEPELIMQIVSVEDVDDRKALQKQLVEQRKKELYAEYLKKGEITNPYIKM